MHIGEFADIHINAYSDRLMKGRISNIGPILDPNIRTAKVRLEVDNPGFLRLGMFGDGDFSRCETRSIGCRAGHRDFAFA